MYLHITLISIIRHTSVFFSSQAFQSVFVHLVFEQRFDLFRPAVGYLIGCLALVFS